MEDEVRYVIEGGVLPTTKVGSLEFPKGSKEAQRCVDIGAILKDYSARAASRPLSVAVFGPPGSGKSRCVEEIAGSLKPTLETPAIATSVGKKNNVGSTLNLEVGAAKFDELVVINISQLANTDDLATAIKNGVDQKQDLIPILFFDEFDAPLAGVSLGWLRWFLAPMQDGKIMVGGEAIKFGKAVFMFAGGTATSLAEFEERAALDKVAFREKKVPDFISRLRGFIDIQGINNRDSEQKVRRALLLRYLLKKRWPNQSSSARFPIDEGLVNSLLSTVHFLHGVRSMEALLDMSKLDDGKVELPEPQLRKLHLSRGVLDGKLVGVSAGLKEVGVSAGLKEADHLLGKLTGALLRDGAKLAYGGDFAPDGTLDQILRAAKGVPDDLFDSTDKRIRNYLGIPSYLGHPVKSAQQEHSNIIEFFNLKTLSSQEIKDLNLRDNEWFPARPRNKSETYQANHHLAWAISLFRMRVRLTHDIDALIVFGGKDGESWGRFPGIAEEVMLALAFGKPIYIMGGVGGAASAVGKLLGLGDTIANPDECLNEVKPMSALCPPRFRRAFAVPDHQLPETIEEMRDYFFQHSLTTKAWPWNGLEPADNRELFCADVSSEPARCVDIIVKGLSRLEWKRPLSRQEY
jgi:hypothetical protein